MWHRMCGHHIFGCFVFGLRCSQLDISGLWRRSDDIQRHFVQRHNFSSYICPHQSHVL